ncbi:MAG TPA: Gfo/Idh/MocA family oxidoreductase [Candidatus Hydrogenedentes bacterium]|mgnify:FL=1|nr:Gfo/Idh/MocA family oxidoreductase [Candidatus Hydrogenedentota bacterium]HRT21688.1 Gfo/Idh/MocA family oxidoreductase [Candidatus Hydrogenedentota bacterium]HRT66529.1 Gfo/Idh/MocA family oxidoreductase [Candidatus Hydrogenedentota bacterium]
MKAPVGIGVLSFAHGHVGAYVDVMKNFADVRLVSAYDDNEQRGKGVCDNAGMRYTPHVEDVLDDPNVQAVMVGSETCRHAELCIAAARAGKHILCQKPMALSLEDCDRMIAAAEKAGVMLAVAFQMRHDPANIRMREIVQSGELGRIAVIRRRHCIGVLLMESFVNGPTHWHIEADKNMGMFMDDATHPADWFHWMLGKPVSVIAEIDNVITHVAPDDNGVAVFRFAQGEMGIVFNSSTVMASENTTEIYGEKGCVIQNYGDAPSCDTRLPGGIAVKMFKYGEGKWQDLGVPIPPGHGCRIQAVPRPWVDSLVNETPPAATGHDGRVAVEMILGAYKAAREGRRVTFPL